MARAVRVGMAKPDELSTLDPSTLHTVTGGIAIASGAGKSGNDDFQTQLAMQTLQSSIKDIGRSQQQNQNDPMAMMLPMMMMMKMRG